MAMLGEPDLQNKSDIRSPAKFFICICLYRHTFVCVSKILPCGKRSDFCHSFRYSAPLVSLSNGNTQEIDTTLISSSFLISRLCSIAQNGASFQSPGNTCIAVNPVLCFRGLMHSRASAPVNFGLKATASGFCAFKDDVCIL